MSTGLNGFLNGPAVSTIRGRGAEAPAPAKSAGFALDGILARIDRVEEEKGELAGEFMRAFIEGNFRRRGIPLNLKSKGERELEQRQSKLAAVELEKLETTNQVNEVLAFLLDHGESKISDVFGGDETRTVSEVFGTRLDASIAQRPDDFLTVSRGLFKMTAIKAFNLKRSDLFLSEFTKPFAKQTVEQLGSARAAQQVAAQGSFEKNIAFQQELQSGEGAAAASFDQRLEGVGESLDQDLSPGIFGDDFDTARGSAGVVTAVLAQGDEFASKGLGPETLLGILLGETGQRIGSVLGGGDVVQDEDDRRILKVQEGDTFNDPKAVGNFMVLIDKISTETGRSRTDLFQLMGLPFEDVDEGDLQRAREGLFGQGE